MKIKNSYWFSGGFGTIGIITGEDEITGKKKAYIGRAPLLSESLDAISIAKIGSPVELIQFKNIVADLEG